MNLKHDAKKGVPPSVCIHFRLESEVWSWGPPECVVICCKHSMKEAESKITGFVHLLKRRKSSVLKCLCLCCGSGHSKPPRQQCLALLLCMYGEYATALTLLVSSHLHNVCCPQRLLRCRYQSKNCLPGPSCLFSVWASWEECPPAPSH